jgi:hypothetical protein
MAPRDTVRLACDWPGFGEGGSAVIPLPPQAWPPPTHAIVHAGRAYAPRPELHVTVVGRALAARLQHAIAAGLLDDTALAAAFAAAGPWRLRRSGWRIALRKEDQDAPAGARESIIEPVALPALARFHRRLGARLGEVLALPPPHVTLYVVGGGEGIGVPDPQTLARLCVGPAWRDGAGDGDAA